MVTVPATVITAILATVITAAAIRGIPAAAMPRRIAAAMPPAIMAGTALLTTATTMHRRTTAIDTAGSFVRPMPTMAVPGIMACGITGGTATIGIGEFP